MVNPHCQINAYLKVPLAPCIPQLPPLKAGWSQALTRAKEVRHERFGGSCVMRGAEDTDLGIHVHYPTQPTCHMGQQIRDGLFPQYLSPFFLSIVVVVRLLFLTPWATAHQASLSFTIFRNKDPNFIWTHSCCNQDYVPQNPLLPSEACDKFCPKVCKLKCYVWLPGSVLQ